jgi:hypothetical protein
MTKAYMSRGYVLRLRAVMTGLPHGLTYTPAQGKRI